MNKLGLYNWLKNDVDSHGIYTVEQAQKKLDEFDINIKLHRGWKVTQRFIKELEKTGGFMKLPVGTPIIDGQGIVRAIMNRLEIRSSGSYNGRGTQFYSDLSDIRKALGIHE